jgi:hypothetical protein
MSRSKFLPSRLSQAIVVALILNIAACNGDNDGSNDEITKPSKPSSLGAQQIVDVPVVFYPLPSITNLANNSDSTLKYGDTRLVAHLSH